MDNRSDHEATIDATFRVAGKEPELWRAETGTTEPVSFKIADGRTTVPLQLEPWGTVFVVFRKATSETSHTLPEMTETKVATISGPWNVAFQSGRGAPDSITLNELSDWSRSDDPGVKYFSGVGTYTKTVQASPDWFKKGAQSVDRPGRRQEPGRGDRQWQRARTDVARPYRVDATSALKPGANEITIKVVNAWVNRLIGDEQPGATKITFADVKPYKANSPLLPSGLLGPVTVVRDEAH